MKKIILLPLDERPCNYRYPSLLPKAGYELLLPPKGIMGDKKKPADTAAIAAWLSEHIGEVDACVLSLDTLIYGGIVPSRLHHETQETLIKRAATVEELRRRNPAVKLYLFELIMRCPDYSSSDEEPDYYDDYGRELHLYGRYTHLEKLGKLTEEDRAEFEKIKRKIPADILHDFTERRKTNLAVLMHNLEYIKRGIADYFVVPQDDAAVYGFTSMDQMTVRSYLKENTLHMKTAMYPSADDTGLSLLARAVCALEGVRPKIFVQYASSKAGGVVPFFEDRALDETVQYHILCVHGQRVYSLPEADIVLALNMGSRMCEGDDPARVTAYDVERNLAAFVSYIGYALGEGKVVAVGDVAYCNRGDEELIRILNSENLLMRLSSYAGWNTSSNTIGTALSAAVHFRLGKDDTGRRRFLLHRYFEDIGYMAHTRAYVTERELPAMGLNYFRTDGENGAVARLVERETATYMQSHFPEIAALVKTVHVKMPWRRMFETDITLEIEE